MLLRMMLVLAGIFLGWSMRSAYQLFWNCKFYKSLDEISSILKRR